MKRFAALSILLAACSAQSAPGDLHAYFVRLSACGGSAIEENEATVARVPALERVAMLEGLPPSACAATAADCDAFWRCLGVDMQATCDGSVPTSCTDATELRTCPSSGHPQTFDCAERGERCISGSGGAAGCGAQACTALGVRCDGNTVVACDRGIETRQSCAGQTCAEASDGTGAVCVDVVESCSTPRCDGASLLLCSSLGVGRTRIECSDLVGPGATCDVASATCVPATSGCTIEQSHCEGDAIHYCVLGSFERFDCASFGATCLQTADVLGTPAFVCARR